MARLVVFFIFFIPSVTSAQYDGFPQIVNLFKDGCEPQTTCRTDLRGRDGDFSLRWRSYREGTGSFMAMEINGQTFNISTSPELIRGKPFPLDLYIFSPSLKLYGSLSAAGTGGVYVHYFLRDGDGVFHHLGRLTFLAYDEDSGRLVRGENFGPGERITSYYKLVENSLVLERTENSLDGQ